MASYCLPKAFAGKFMKALKDGTINPADLMDMTSAERRAFFLPIVGVEHAQEVNSLFESKMLLKDVKRGLVTWAKTVGGVSEPTRRDLLTKINRMPDELLNPADQNKFLSDIAATKLGVSVTADEAKEIFELTRAATDAEAIAQQNSNPATWTAYGNAKIRLTEAVEAMKPNRTQWALEVLSATKSTMATLDLSAPLVQGWGSMATREFWEGLPKMFQYFSSEEKLQDLRGYIAGHPLYDTMRQAKLGIVELSDRLTLREEAIQSSLIEKANTYLNKKYGVPNVVRMSNRAFVGFLNYVRVKSFENMAAAVKMAGEELTPQVARDIANVANDFTGRGAIGVGDKYSGFTVMNTVIWTPRKISATLNMMNPWRYVNPAIHPVARRAALSRLLGSLAMTGTALSLARLAGYTVDDDPTSTNFLRIKSGNTAFDISGGNAAYVRLIARIVEQQSVSARGNLTEFGTGYGQKTSADAVIDFARGRLAPNASVIADALYGKDPAGRPFSVTQEMSDKLVPMTINNYIDLAQHDPGNMGALILSPLTIFGAGMQVQIQPQTGRFDVWGDPAGTDHSDSPVDRKLRSLGIYPNLPERSIRGVKLSDALYDEYQFRSGEQMRDRVGELIRTPGFNDLKMGEQEQFLRDTWNSARSDARDLMIAKHPEIMIEADRLKDERASKGSPSAIARRGSQ